MISQARQSTGPHISKSQISARRGTPSNAAQPPPRGDLRRDLGNRTVAEWHWPGPIQAKLKVGAPNDRFEQEADRVADQVMRMPLPEGTGLLGAPHGIQRSCAACAAAATPCAKCGGAEEDIQRKPLAATITPLVQRQESVPEEDEDHTLQAKATPGQAQTLGPTTRGLVTALQGGGQPLAAAQRAFFEPRFGADLSAVRIHRDAAAAAAARSVGARAYALGRDVVFGQGEYRPETPAGRHLLAHELTHTIQQSASGVPAVQRRLTVNKNAPSFAPANDPANALTQTQRLTEMNTLIQALCGNFQVDSSTGEVTEISPQCNDPDAVASGGNPTGCCCLCVMTNPAGNNWTIEVSQVVGPHTRRGSHQVVMSPSTSPVEFGAFTGANTLAIQGSVPAMGHELCGHAALMEMNAHPATADRTRTNVHDPTVRIENLISGEQGVPAGDLRGLAASGSHRGESVDRIVIHYGFNQTLVPAAEQPKVDFAADYINENQSWVDVLGHSDAVGSASAKLDVSQRRADAMKAALNSAGVSDTITKIFGPSTTMSGNRFTRIEGRSDFDLIPGASAAQQRRVEILIAGFPAGAQNPIAGTPTTTTPVGAQSPGAMLAGLFFGTACEQQLIGGAWT